MQAAWRETDTNGETPEALVEALRLAASWPGLDRVEVVQHGDLAAALANRLTRPD